MTWHATVSHLANESLKASKIKRGKFLLDHTITNFHNSRNSLNFSITYLCYHCHILKLDVHMQRNILL